VRLRCQAHLRNPCVLHDRVELTSSTNGAVRSLGEETISDASNLSPAITRILVVEDFEPFRAFVTSLLKESPDMRVICEATDGLDAVAKAEQLTPDLILMDIGLPKLSGIEAARQILEFAPAAKIIFLTQESSAEVVHEALQSGACGYVLKSRAGNDLWEAINAALRGEQFVGRGLARP
jgi:DNA-binding NarL/FixJ family response regulator